MATVHAAVVAAAAGKGVKDVLKARGWLHVGLKPGAAGEGRLAFPLEPDALDAIRDAVNAGELSAIECIRPFDGSALAVKKTPPPQGKKASKAGAAPPRAPPQRPKAAQERSFGSGARSHAEAHLPPAPAVRRVHCPTHADAEWLQCNVFSLREPTVLTGLQLGACHGGWTAERLAKAACKASSVSVHVCASATVDLAGHRAPNTPRNFVFRSMPFSEAVQRCSGGSSESLPPLLASGERYYLRSVGLDVRKDAADFPSLFPDLAVECALLPSESAEQPCLVDVSAYHSSVLRLASDDTQLWTHFDVMDNMLAQMTGRKRVVLWPPTEDEHLYVEGSSSRVGNIDSWNDAEFPLYRRSVPARTETELGPGDVLFIPALWFHNVTSVGFSVALNVFWRSHHGRNGTGMYDPKDLYGNRDPPLATGALDHVAAAITALAELPQPFRSFYARRAARELLQVAEVGASGGRSGGADGPNAVLSRDPSHSAQQTDPHQSANPAHPRAGGPRVVLGSGVSMPLLGLGTWEVPSGDVGHAVETALAHGVRHIDCAASYRNEAAVGAALGAALASGHVRRQDLFVTSKLWNGDHMRVRDACIASLRALQLDHLDLYLVHWPPRDASAMLETWRQMEALVTEGLAFSIGVCNCSVRKLQAILDVEPAVPPAVNQVEAHPGWRNDELLAFCQSHGIHLTAFAPLGRGAASAMPSLLESDNVVASANALGCTPAQLLLRWGLRRGTSVIPKSVRMQRIAENAHAIQPLSSDPATEAEWLGRLDSIPQQRRLTGEYFIGRGEARHNYASLAELWDGP